EPNVGAVDQGQASQVTKEIGENKNDFDPFLDLDTLDDADMEISKSVGKGKGGLETVEENEIIIGGGNETKINDVIDVEEGSDSESSNGTDSDELVDKENRVEHIHVDMDTFDKSNVDKLDVEDRQGKFNSNEEIDVDLDVINNEEFKSALDEYGLERVRKRKLKQLRKQNKPKHGDVHKYYFYKNDKQRVRAECRGKIPVFKPTGNDGLSQGAGPSQVTGPNNEPGSSQKEKWTKGKISASKGIDYSPNSGSQSRVVGGKPKLRKCLQSRKIKYCTANFLSEEIMDQIESNLEVPIKAIQDQLQKKYQVEVSMMKAFRAKSKAVDQVRGDYTSLALNQKQTTHVPQEFSKRSISVWVLLGAGQRGSDLAKACAWSGVISLGLDRASMFP
ncbi:hypothetical protein Tco_1202512, partial [Tanacetum coccineum]